MMRMLCELIIIIAVFLNVSAVVAQSSTWSSEAEAGILSGTAEIKEGCDNAFGGKFVKLGAETGNSLSFSNVEIEEAGSYRLKIFHFNEASVALSILVNGETLGVTNFQEALWCYQGAPHETTVEVTLQQGYNTISFEKAPGLSFPLLDRFVLLPLSSNILPQNYYVSSSTGDDLNDGLTEATPWKTLNKLNIAYFNPGDSALFKAGDTFVGQLKVNNSGVKDKPIVFGKYGEGANPVLDGASDEDGAHLATIFINNREYIEIADLEITNDRLFPRAGVVDELAYGIYVLNDGVDIMHHFRFHDLTIRDVFAITTEGTEFNSIKVAAIGFKSSKNDQFGKEKNIRDVIVEDCYITRTTRYGIHTMHGGGTDGVGNDSINRNMNMIFRNNHFYHTGGTCIMPGRVYNCLVENNIFDYPGSDIDPRMANRGSGAWYWSSRNVISQYNKSYHVRGNGDSYGQHIDFGNRNVILQYNYSEDSEGGFVEILGKNVNSTYRFNVSVNDGFRDRKGNSLWVSTYAGTGNSIPSDSNYIYNNTIYVDADITPDIYIEGMNTFVYNNIFYATGNATIGEQVSVKISAGSELKMANNLFYGNVSTTFFNYDENPTWGNPQFSEQGALNVDGYKLKPGSTALDKGRMFPEPKFPMAGKGIFKDVKHYPEFDLYGNPVNLSTAIPHIGAYNGMPVNGTGIDDLEILDTETCTLFPNPVKSALYASFKAKQTGKLKIHIATLNGISLQTKSYSVVQGKNSLKIDLDPSIPNGIYLLSIEEDGYYLSKRFVLVR